MSKQLDAIMKPKSVAVIGASTKARTIGSEIMTKLVDYKFNGEIYPINPKADTVNGLKAYKSILDVPGKVDLAVIVVAKNFVLDVIDQCAQKGITGVAIISAGFKETGEEGQALEDALVAKLKENNMRAVGPNCLGVINTNENIRLDATFAEELPAAGKVAFVSQSGALGGGILNILKDLGVGFSQFMSIGNQADINAETMLEYWEDDADVSQVLLYMESITNPANFRELTSRITKKKPVIALKSGKSAQGASAASSHTGSLAGADVAADALLKQGGVIRANTLLEMFEIAKVFETCPMPKGNRVAIMTNSGGPGIMATDALVENGLEIAELTAKTTEALKSFLPSAASVKNPVDMIASAPIEHYKQTLETLLADENVDMVMAIYLPFMGVQPMDAAKALMEIKAAHPEKPVVAVFMAKQDFFAAISEVETNMPFYMFAEPAANVMAKLDQQRKWIERPVGKIENFTVDSAKVKQIIKATLKEDRDQLTTLESIDVLEAYGIRSCKYAFANSVDEAAKSATEIGYPVVMKITSPRISHKTEVGGVIVGIQTEADLRKEYADLFERLISKGYGKEDLDGVIIQEMVKGNRELVCGIANDPQYGHLMMFGLGGIYVETIKDVAFKVAPLSDIDAQDLMESVKAYEILEGARGVEKANIPQIKETLLRLSQLVTDFDFIEELDINPIKVSEKTLEGIAVDGRIRVDMEKAKAALSSCGCSCGCSK